MRFTYNSKEKIYELRNKMNSTVKRLSEVAILFDETSGKMISYGDPFKINQELSKYAEAKKYNYCVIRSNSWDLEYLNKIINGILKYHDIEGNKDMAVKWFYAYYPNPY